MGRKRDLERRSFERRNFEESRIIDVTDERAMDFWSQRLGVSAAEIIAVVREVGPNSTAVALKLEAPQENGVSPPLTPR